MIRAEQVFEDVFCRARQMLSMGMEPKDAISILMRSGVAEDIAYFAVKGAQMALKSW